MNLRYKRYGYLNIFKCSILIHLLVFTGCQKDFLEKKPVRSQLVPKTVSDFQAISDLAIFFQAPAIQEVSSGDFTISDIGLSSLAIIQANVYKWDPNPFAGQTNVQDWSVPHTQIFYANIVLEGLEDISGAERNSFDYNNVKGNALFNRAFAFYNLAQVFAAPYNPATANKLPGIPLRLVSDLKATYPRGTVQQTYDHIIADLQASLLLLPDKVNYKNRACKAAVYALLARVYLSMGDYANAELYADRTLKVRNELLDYSTIKGNATDRLMPSALPNGNAEVILYKGALNYAFPGSSSAASVVSPLYNLYSSDDLRKSLFFRDRGNGVLTWRGTYGGTVNVVLFTGLATDELYLIRSECAARRGDLAFALSDLNTLLVTRFAKGKYVPYSGTDKELVLKIILTERRKELIARGLRWTDLRRLNFDSRFALELKRVVSGVEYTLLPNSTKYTFRIPDNEVGKDGIEQNP